MRNGVDGANGVYSYSTTSVFPTQTYQSEGYFVDVVFNTTNGPDVTPPAVKSVTPVRRRIGRADERRSADVDIHEAMDPATITNANVLLRNSPSTVVPARCLLRRPPRSTATIDADVFAPVLDDLHRVVKGGDDAVKDPAGNAMTADYHVVVHDLGAAAAAADAGPGRPGPGCDLVVESVQHVLRGDSPHRRSERVCDRGYLDGDRRDLDPATTW